MKKAEEALKEEMLKEGYQHAENTTKWFKNVNVDHAIQVLRRVSKRFPRSR